MLATRWSWKNYSAAGCTASYLDRVTDSYHHAIVLYPHADLWGFTTARRRSIIHAGEKTCGHNQSQRWYGNLLQRLGQRTCSGLFARMAAQRRCLGCADALP